MYIKKIKIKMKLVIFLILIYRKHLIQGKNGLNDLTQ